MIIVSLRGGLGNQMFCYALGRHLEERSSRRIKYDKFTYWDVFVDDFNIELDFASVDDINSVCYHDKIKSGIIKYGQQLRHIPYGPQMAAKLFNFHLEIKPRGLPGRPPLDWAYRRQYYEPILQIDSDAYLFGYWQSPKYLEGIESILRDEFRVPDLDEANQSMAREIEGTDSIAIHIRRGDVAEHGDADPLDYFILAADYVASRVPDPHFFIFSDDPEYAREELDLAHPTTLVTQNSPETPHLDMDLLRRCDHHVNSTSTFSWWGAWLNDHDDQIVTFPRPFTRGGGTQEHMRRWDYLPEDWTFIDYE